MLSGQPCTRSRRPRDPGPGSSQPGSPWRPGGLAASPGRCTGTTGLALHIIVASGSHPTGSAYSAISICQDHKWTHLA